MDRAAAATSPFASGELMECPKCGGVMIVHRSRMGANGRLRRFHCKACGHRLTDSSSGKMTRVRLIDDAAVIAIRQLPVTPAEQKLLAEQYNCSSELIRQIQTGKIYTDLLPDWFRSPPKAGDPHCEQCRFCVDGCTMGFPEFEIEGPRFARDCSAFYAKGC